MLTTLISTIFQTGAKILQPHDMCSGLKWKKKRLSNQIWIKLNIVGKVTNGLLDILSFSWFMNIYNHQ